MKQFNFTTSLLNYKILNTKYISLINMHVANSNAGSMQTNDMYKKKRQWNSSYYSRHRGIKYCALCTEHTCRYNRFSYLNQYNYNISQDFLPSTGIKIAFLFELSEFILYGPRFNFATFEGHRIRLISTLKCIGMVLFDSKMLAQP